MNALLAVALALAQVTPERQALNDVAMSHIEANVPPLAEFDVLMRRDLQAYFHTTTGKEGVATYELLREGATQTGVSYPKFYVWARFQTADGAISEGAARVAAIERKSFQVANFLSKSEILAQPSGIYAVFPAPVCQRINAKLDVAK